MIKRFTSKLIEKTYLTEDVIKLVFEKPKDFNFKAGQYLNIEVEKEGIRKLKAYSILSPPKKDILEFCIKIVEGGMGSNVLADSKEGENFNMMGPLGHLGFDEKGKKHIFICAGTGITPFYSIIKEYFDDTKSFTLVAGYRYKKNILFHEELIELEDKNDLFTYITCLSKDSWHNEGRVQKFIPIDKEATYYICGLKELVLETKEFLTQKGIDKIFIERYS